jgi:hypothetical protein
LFFSTFDQGRLDSKHIELAHAEGTSLDGASLSEIGVDLRRFVSVNPSDFVSIEPTNQLSPPPLALSDLPYSPDSKSPFSSPDPKRRPTTSALADQLFTAAMAASGPLPSTPLFPPGTPSSKRSSVYARRRIDTPGSTYPAPLTPSLSLPLAIDWHMPKAEVCCLFIFILFIYLFLYLALFFFFFWLLISLYICLV